MTVEKFIYLKDAIQTTDTKELTNIVMEHLNNIKETLQILKMIVLELQIRKEQENGK